MKTDPYWIDPRYTLSRRARDFGVTYDGYTIVSRAFRETLSGSDVDFLPLPRCDTHFVLRANETVRLDTARIGTKFEEWCDTCSRFTSVARFGFHQLTDEALPSPDRLFRSDVEFGWKNGQKPHFLVGVDLAWRMLPQEFSGVYFEPIDTDRWAR